METKLYTKDEKNQELLITKNKLYESYKKLSSFGKMPEKNDRNWKYITKFVSDVWEFASLKFEINKVENRGEEIMNFCTSFAKKICEGTAAFDSSYNSDNESEKNLEDKFAAYIYVSIKNTIIHKTAEEISDELGGLSFGNKTIYLQLNKLRKILRNCDKDLNSEETILWLADVMNCSTEKIKELMDFLQVSSENLTYSNEAGKEVSKIDDQNVLNSYYSNRTSSDFEEFFIFRLSDVNSAFIKLQERTRKYVSALLTRDIFYNLTKKEKNGQNISRILICDKMKEQNFDFVDQEIYTDWRNEKELPSQEEIAAQFGKDKTDASRTLKNFWKKIPEQTKELMR